MSMTEREKYRIAVEVLEKEQEPYSQKASDLIGKKYSVGLTKEEQDLLTMVDKTNQQYHKIIADLRSVAGLNTMDETPEEAGRADEEAHALVSEWLAGYGD